MKKHEFIHPVETRYRTEIASIFTEDEKFMKWMEVEARLAEVHAEMGTISREAAEEIDRARSRVKTERIKELDRQIHHDIMAMVKALSEQCEGDAGNYVHLGATSYDIQDTASCMQIVSALKHIKSSIKTLLIELLRLADEHKRLVCIGRTHGQHAIPTTYGMRSVYGYMK